MNALEAQPITEADRCDVCNARAKVRVELTNGLLMFCAHHARKNKDAIIKVAKNVIVKMEDEDYQNHRARLREFEA